MIQLEQQVDALDSFECGESSGGTALAFENNRGIGMLKCMEMMGKELKHWPKENAAKLKAANFEYFVKSQGEQHTSSIERGCKS